MGSVNLSVEQSFCIFLDILGFKKMVLDNASLNKSNECLRKLDKALAEAKVGFSYAKWEQKFFTDNIVLGSSVETSYCGHGENNFVDIIPEITEYELSMVLDGFFIRGGWACGELYMNDQLVYGDSLVYAYELESKRAIFPRIVFSKKMNSKINSQVEPYRNKSNTPQWAYVLADQDGSYFINYLFAAIQKPEDLGFSFCSGSHPINFKAIKEYATEKLEKHRDIITDKIKEYKDKEEVLGKYLWSAAYHNFFLKEFFKDYPSTLEIKIPKTTFSFRRI